MTGIINLNDDLKINELSIGVRLLFSILKKFQKKREEKGIAVDVIEFSQEEISKETNVARQTVAKYLNEFEVSGLISYVDGKITINKGFYRGGMLDLTAIKNYMCLCPGVRALLAILTVAPHSCAVRISKADVAICVGISSTALMSHVRGFARSGVLKYRYSGDIFVNPDFFYTGTGEKEHLNAVRENYLKFKSNI